MGVYKKQVITDQGNNLIARAVAGEARIQFSHVRISSYVYPSGTDFTQLSELQDIQQTVIPADVRTVGDSLIMVRSMFGNENVLKAYLIENVAVYASDGETEVLFSISQASEPDQMPVYNGVAPSAFIFDIQLTIEQASSIALEINPAGTVTIRDLMDVRDRIYILETKVEEAQSIKNVTLPAANWTGTEAPFVQTVTVEGITGMDKPGQGIIYPENCTRAQQKAINKAAGYLYDLETGDGTITFRATLKPTVDITLGLKGVV